MNKYEVLGVVGEGAYGVVIKSKNRENNEIVAIKKFKDSDEDELIRKNAQREIKMLRMLKNENIVDLKEAFKRKNHIHLVFEYVEKNLLEVLEQSPNGLEPVYIKKIIYQLAKAIDFCHSNNVIHRDIKPENLLVTKNDILKLCDFGFARPLPTIAGGSLMTDYVATRWYRAPELLLSMHYSTPVDMWAIGCIMAELIDGQPLFPGDNEIDQLNRIQKLIGPLTKEQNKSMNENKRYKDAHIVGRKGGELEKRFLGKVEKREISFLKSVLKMEPSERLSSREALMHGYFDEVREIEESRGRKIGETTEKTMEVIREERINLDKKRIERKENVLSLEDPYHENKKSLTETMTKENVKIPSYVSEKLLRNSIYAYQINDEKKIEDILPQSKNDLTNLKEFKTTLFQTHLKPKNQFKISQKTGHFGYHAEKRGVLKSIDNIKSKQEKQKPQLPFLSKNINFQKSEILGNSQILLNKVHGNNFNQFNSSTISLARYRQSKN